MVSQTCQQGTEQATHVPRLPRAYVPRPRLWTRLDAATDASLTLLVGPGGSGKTLGVSGWLRRDERAQESAWVLGDATWVPDRLAPLLDETTSDGRPRLLVIDDAHLLPMATVRALDDRLETAPDSFRVLLIARWDLPFARLGPELMGHLTVLRGELLRLDESESAALVAAHVPGDSDEVARAIAPRTQGWCAAVVLTARAVAAATDPLATARRYADGGSTVADRVASEVFATLQPRQRHLLLCVSGEPVVTPALAVHLSHDVRAGEALADLEAMGLLVTRVSAPPGSADGPEAWDHYRIHPLLTEVVRRRLAAGGVDVLRAAATVRRAVQLDVARGSTREAFGRLLDIGDHAAAATLLAEHGVTLLARGHGARVHDFALEHPSLVDVRPGAWFALAAERWSAGKVDAARQWLDRIVADPMPDTSTTALQLASARLMRSRLGLEPIVAAATNARQVLAGEHDTLTDHLVPMLLCELAVTQTWLGDLDRAEEALTRAVLLSRSHDLPGLTTSALSHLALTVFMLGRENASIALADEVRSLSGTSTGAGTGGDRPYAAQRAELATALSLGTGIESLHTGPRAVDDTVWAFHPADLSSKFWARMHRSRVLLARGSVSGAERALDVPLETPGLPDHLASAMDLERAFLASLSGDAAGLGRSLERLEAAARPARPPWSPGCGPTSTGTAGSPSTASPRLPSSRGSSSHRCAPSPWSPEPSWAATRHRASCSRRWWPPRRVAPRCPSWAGAGTGPSSPSCSRPSTPPATSAGSASSAPPWPTARGSRPTSDRPPPGPVSAWPCRKARSDRTSAPASATSSSSSPAGRRTPTSPPTCSSPRTP